MNDAAVHEDLAEIMHTDLGMRKQRRMSVCMGGKGGGETFNRKEGRKEGDI